MKPRLLPSSKFRLRYSFHIYSPIFSSSYSYIQDILIIIIIPMNIQRWFHLIQTNVNVIPSMKLKYTQVDMTLAGYPVSVLNMGGGGWGGGGTDLKALRTKTNNENEKRTG
ncbi:hypothetical protein ACHAXM_001401 [Skeletonema potamos]